MLGVITFSELVVGVLAVLGIIQIYTSGLTTLGLYSSVIAAKVLLALLFGQRVTKDYPGAMTIAIYFLVTIFGVFILKHI